MKNIKNSIMCLCLLFAFCAFLSSCSTEKDKIDQNDSNTKNESTNKGIEITSKYDAQGKIVKIDENGIHVLVGDKIQRYNVDNEVALKHYIGEYIGINELSDNKYGVVADEYHDYKNKYTSTGDPIKSITGTVAEVKNDFVTVIAEMGNVKLTNPGNFNLKNGDQVMIYYVEMTGGNQMVSYYEESSKINMQVKEISRDSTGVMKIFAASDNKEYDIQVNENTVTNFPHSFLKKNENIIVYPDSISGDIPAVVKAKLIIK